MFEFNPKVNFSVKRSIFPAINNTTKAVGPKQAHLA